MAKQHFNPYKYKQSRRTNQTGRGLHGRYRDSYMIPVKSKAEDIVEPNPVPMTMVPPVAAAEDRALSEMKTEKEKPHVKVRKIIKRKKKISRKKSNKRSTSKTKKKKTHRRKNSNDYSDSVE